MSQSGRRIKKREVGGVFFVVVLAFFILYTYKLCITVLGVCHATFYMLVFSRCSVLLLCWSYVVQLCVNIYNSCVAVVC